MSRTRKFLGGLSVGFLNQAVVMLASLWLTPFVLSRLGQHSYGLWLICTQILGYLGLLDFGIVALIPRETAFAVGRAGGIERANELGQLVSRVTRLVLWQLPPVALVTLAVWWCLPAEWEPLRRPLGWVMLTFVALFPLRIPLAVLQGLQDLRFAAGLQLASWVLNAFVTVLLVWMGRGIEALSIGWIVGQVASAIASGYRLWTRFPAAFPRDLSILSWDKTKGWLARSAWVSVAQVAQVLMNGSEFLVIGKMLGPAATVPYACTAKLVQVFSNHPTMVMQTAGPALAELRGADQNGRLSPVTGGLTQGTLLLSGAIACIVLAVNRGFVQWWVGGGQYAGDGLTLLLIFTMLLRHWNITAIYTIFAFGYEKRISIVAILDGIITALGMMAGVWLWGAPGAAVGSLLGVCLAGLPGNLSPLGKEAKISGGRLVGALWPWFSRLMLVLAASAAIALFKPPVGWLQVGLIAAIVGLVYAAIMLPVALRLPLGNLLTPRPLA